MSVAVPIDFLSDDQIKLITKHLTMTPIDPKEEEQKKWRFGPKIPTKPKVSLLMFKISEDQKTIYLPYRFACVLAYGKLLNMDRPHIKIIHDNKPAFGLQLREEQIPIVQEAYQQLCTYNTTTLGLYPGIGKTYMGTYLAYLFGNVTMVYCNRESIMKQWFKTFSKSVPDYTNYIWMVGEQDAPPEGNVPAFIICMEERYTKIPQYILKAIGTLIIDEAHMFCTPTAVNCLLAEGLYPSKIIIETATLERDDGMHQMIQSIAGEHGVFMVSKIPYMFMQIYTRVAPEVTKGKFGTNFDLLCKTLANDESRNNIIIDIVKTNPHRKFIILTRLKEHVELLERLHHNHGIRAATLYGNKNSYSNSPVLIGTMPKMGTGFDEENACDDFSGDKSNVLILALSVKKWQQYEQFRGRVMRCSAPIVIWLHDENSTINNQLELLRPWILGTNGSIHPTYYIQGQVKLPNI